MFFCPGTGLALNCYNLFVTAGIDLKLLQIDSPRSGDEFRKKIIKNIYFFDLKQFQIDTGSNQKDYSYLEPDRSMYKNLHFATLLEYGGICLDRTFFKKYSISVSANRGVDRTFSKKHSISVSANRGANRTFSKKHSISVSTITALFQKSSVSQYRP